MENQLVFSIAEDTKIELGGAKAHSLSKMIRAGFNVPVGFVLSAQAFGSMTPSLEQLLLRKFDELQATFVAVRSSAINEDNIEAAWAGQLDTFLNTKRDNLLQNIEKCWESAGSVRAQAYAKQKSLKTSPVAVIVQKMVQSDVSGVAFSVHPILKDAKKMVIEAGFGLGEALVSGQITPDTYVINKKTNEIIQKQISRQTKKLVKDASGQTIWENLNAGGKTQKLSDEQIAELSSIVNKLEAFFNYPVDIEWAIYENKFYILQSRPITNLAK